MMRLDWYDRAGRVHTVRMRPILRTVLTVLLLMLGQQASPARATVFYVDANVPWLPPVGDGLSWDTAYKYVQDALLGSMPGDEIRVADGLYLPDHSSANPGWIGDRTVTFALHDGVAIRGGYAGWNASDPNARDLSLYVTILSGDLAGDDMPVARPEDLETEPTRAENSYTVVSSISCGPQTQLEGVVVEGGVRGQGTGYGGGLYVSGGSPRIAHCTFRGNYAGYNGGGMAALTSSPTLIGCTFTGNAAAVSGGGMGNRSLGSPVQIDCHFTGNFAREYGGGMDNYSGTTVTMVNCTFRGNATGSAGSEVGRGGGLANNGAAMAMANCVFTGNWANVKGGGIYTSVWDSSAALLTLVNCTFSGNVAPLGGGIHTYYVTLAVSSCTLWCNSDDSGQSQASQLSWVGTVPTIDFNCIQGWDGSLGGTGNIGSDPLLARLPEPGPDGIVATADDDYGNLRLLPESPCVDAASNLLLPADTFDLDNDGDPAEPIPVDLVGRPRQMDVPAAPDVGVGPGWIVDMGAYETPMPGDVNVDLCVDVVDLLWLVEAFGSAQGDPNYNGDCDFNCDASVDVIDLLYLVENFGQCYQ